MVLARELTKKFEEYLRGTPAELLRRLSTRSLKGEFVVIVGPEDEDVRQTCRDSGSPADPARA